MSDLFQVLGLTYGVVIVLWASIALGTGVSASRRGHTSFLWLVSGLLLRPLFALGQCQDAHVGTSPGSCSRGSSP